MTTSISCVFATIELSITQCFFYHSNCPIPGIAGIAKVIKEAYPDRSHTLKINYGNIVLTIPHLDTSFDTKHPYYDPKSVSENPKWFMVF